MRVRISYVAEVPDEYRRAISAYHGVSGLATREEVKDWYKVYGSSMDDELQRLLEDEEN